MNSDLEINTGRISDELSALSSAARDCRLCADVLELGPRPVFQVSTFARILVVSQAPGTRVHATGRPFTDPSGERLRKWMGVNDEIFYDAKKIAILPMGFCYPGRNPRGGDLPPRPECAHHWRAKFDALLGQIEFTLVIGQYAIKHYLPVHKNQNLTQTVKDWRTFLPDFMPLPHPSWRNNSWLKSNIWFSREALPALQSRVRQILEQTPD